MTVESFITIVTFGLTCFSIGVAYGKEHKKKK